MPAPIFRGVGPIIHPSGGGWPTSTTFNTASLPSGSTSTDTLFLLVWVYSKTTNPFNWAAAEVISDEGSWPQMILSSAGIVSQQIPGEGFCRTSGTEDGVLYNFDVWCFSVPASPLVFPATINIYSYDGATLIVGWDGGGVSAPHKFWGAAIVGYSGGAFTSDVKLLATGYDTDVLPYQSGSNVKPPFAGDGTTILLQVTAPYSTTGGSVGGLLGPTLFTERYRSSPVVSGGSRYAGAICVADYMSPVSGPNSRPQWDKPLPAPGGGFYFNFNGQTVGVDTVTGWRIGSIGFQS